MSALVLALALLVGGGDAPQQETAAGYARALDVWADDFVRTAAALYPAAPPGAAAAPPANTAAGDDAPVDRPAAPGLPRLIAEASARFDVPEPWIRAVMQVESEGDAAATSPKGAMGLMQIMPETYAYLSDRYNLGRDPYALRDNILAGSAYLREMYDRFGSAGFLAAYNAGPARYQDYLCGRELPDETKRYVATVRLALGQGLFGQPDSRFYEPIAVSPSGALLIGTTGKPLPVADRLALHSLVARAVERANAAR
ncbi:MAG TPA: lytic transglycosylase domain-containing protein [Stellaceae bacterium]|nr:lytic transglycosylase domain-containing protein [Stellaceae bacterium]